jgi:hypothetical protein
MKKLCLILLHVLQMSIGIRKLLTFHLRAHPTRSGSGNSLPGVKKEEGWLHSFLIITPENQNSPRPFKTHTKGQTEVGIPLLRANEALPFRDSETRQASASILFYSLL